MNQPFVVSRALPALGLWERMKERRSFLEFSLELTARCNNNCRHCYINLPAGDGAAQKREPSLQEIMEVADQAVRLGALWCLITGGEPLLREDFEDIYLALKRKGLLVSVFTNATLISEEHIDLFRRYPPRDIEVTVYGVTKDTYESITRKAGSFQEFNRGLNLLLKSGLKVRLKAMALRSNLHELPQIAQFCRVKTKDYFRFDPVLHLRLDRDPARNDEIRSERLGPEEIVALERADPERYHAMEKCCDKLINPQLCDIKCGHLFHCGAGVGSFVLGFDGNLRLCLSLQQPECVYDMRKGSLAEAWQDFVPRVRDMRSSREEFLKTCRVCPIVNLCSWCPAHAYLEEGSMDAQVSYFCQVAHARMESLCGSQRG